MKRVEWNRRSGALRKLMKELRTYRPNSTSRYLEYCFGAVWHGGAGLWHVYNLNTNNCIATVRFVNMLRGGELQEDSRVIIRYRPNSWYRDILSGFNYDVRTLHAPSTNLSKRSRWVKEQLRDRVVQNYAISRAPEGVSSSRTREAIEFFEPMLTPFGVHRRPQRPRDSRGRFITYAEYSRREAQSRLDSSMQQRVQEMQQMMRPRSQTIQYASSPQVAFYNQVEPMVLDEAVDEQSF